MVEGEEWEENESLPTFSRNSLVVTLLAKVGDQATGRPVRQGVQTHIFHFTVNHFKHQTMDCISPPTEAWTAILHS